MAHLINMAEVECAHTDDAWHLFLKIEVCIYDDTRLRTYRKAVLVASVTRIILWTTSAVAILNTTGRRSILM